LVAHSGTIREGMICMSTPAKQLEDTQIHASWCTWSEPMLRVHGSPVPFKYTERFGSLQEVVDWVRREPNALIDNATRVDGILSCHSLSRSTSNLTALALLSWLDNTWWGHTPERDWYTVWE